MPILSAARGPFEILGPLIASLLFAVWVVLAAWLPRLLPAQRLRTVPWTGSGILLSLLAGILLVPGFCQLILVESGFLSLVYGPGFQSALLEQTSGPEHQLASARLNVWLVSMTLPLSIPLILVILWRISGALPYQVGLTTNQLRHNLLIGLVGVLVLAPPVYVLSLLVNALARNADPGAVENHPLERLITDHSLPLDLGLLVFSAVVAAPLLEEFLFRGVIQPWACRRGGAWLTMGGACLVALVLRAEKIWENLGPLDLRGLAWELQPALLVLLLLPGFLIAPRLLRRWCPWPGVVQGIYATSVLFAISHARVWPSPVPLFFLALGMGWLAFRTQSLASTILLHSLFNGIACVMLVLKLSVE